MGLCPHGLKFMIINTYLQRFYISPVSLRMRKQIFRSRKDPPPSAIAHIQHAFVDAHSTFVRVFGPQDGSDRRRPVHGALRRVLRHGVRGGKSWSRGALAFTAVVRPLPGATVGLIEVSSRDFHPGLSDSLSGQLSSRAFRVSFGVLPACARSTTR